MSYRNRAQLPTPAPMSLLLASFTLLFSLILTISGQSQNAIGAHRIFQKTSFSCSGRPAGYYADVETGCQVYHMCDGLGRQFSYSCPNTTLFQQRMLICDHWYMVNCSKAESHYTANLLIGQRDKPFVDDEENNLRTPRPDLLDRPYAPDYSGESFRNQYKQVAAVQNQIRDEAQKNLEKPNSNQLVNGQTRWKIPPPVRTIQPPAYEAQKEEVVKTLVPTVKPFKNTIRPTSKTTTHRPVTQSQQNINGYGNAALHPRKPVVFVSDQDDLGTSHSTRYNMSADFNSAEVTLGKGHKVANARQSEQTTTRTPLVNKDASVKVPSKIYEPPFVYPIYNQDETPSVANPLTLSTSAPFTAHPFTATASTASTTARTVTRPTTVAGKPFTPTASGSLNGGRNHNSLPGLKTQPQHGFSTFQRFDTQTQKVLKDVRTPTPAQGFKPPTPRPPVHTTKTLKPPTTTTNSNAQLPSNDLLPPYVELVLHDVATTQGPPIYYEWKVPSNGLEPPKLDAPIGVDGREYPEAAIDYNTISSPGGFQPTSTINSPTKTATSKENPFLKVAAAAAGTKLTGNSQATKTPTSRSIKETGQPNYSADKSTGAKAQRRSDTVLPTDISEIRKEWLVPEYAFPLETIGRTGYLAADTYNSFQLKIPDRHSDTDAQTHWFGENPKCPECHPSYVVPGTCEPCLRR